MVMKLVVQRLTDKLLGAEAKSPFGFRVDKSYSAEFIGNKDRIGRFIGDVLAQL